MAETLTIRTASSTEVIKIAVQGPQGPAGAPGTGLETLTTKGDTLYRGDTTGERLPIGTSGQVLKVSSSGVPEWGEAPSGVSSWNDLTDKPATFAPSAHTHSGDEVYLGEGGDDAPALLSGFSDASINGVYWPQDFLINGFYVYKKNKQYGLFNENQTWHVFENVPITANIVESSDNDGAEFPWVAAAWNGTVSRAAVSDFGVNAAQQFVFVGDNIPSTQVTGLSIPAASSATPSALGVAAAGSSNDFARADHVHALPSASDIGAAASTHSSTHHTGGTDAIAPNQISAAWAQVLSNQTVTGNTLLSAGRNRRITLFAVGVTANVDLPYENNQAGDVVTLVSDFVVASTLTIRSASVMSGGTPLAYATLATLNASGQSFTFVSDGTATGWSLRSVDTHTHASSQITGLATVATSGDYDDLTNKPTLGTAAASATTDFAASSHTHAATDITSGTLDIARIPTGTTSTTVCIGDDARLSDARTPTSHTHGNITNAGLVGTTANLPLKTGTGGIVEAGAFGTGAGEFAEGNHTHADLHTRSHAITSTSDHTAGAHKVFYSDGSGNITELALGNSGEVLTSNGATSAPSFAAASGGGVTTGSVDNAIIRADGTGGSTSQSSDIVIDDATTSTQANVAIRNNHSETNSALVLCNKGTGAFIVSPAPPDGTSSGGNARGSEAVCIVPSRTNANQVASAVASVAVGGRARASNTYATAIGYSNNSTAEFSTSLGHFCTASGSSSIAIGRVAEATAQDSSAIGRSVVANLRGQFNTYTFNSVYWGGTTTNATPLILNLDATATNRFTIAASTALAVDILLVARRSDTQDKWLVARRFLGIRRDGSNNTSLIGSVQTLGTDQSDGSPSWSFTLTADDTNEALQLEVTGAASETVQWRATAFYRVV